jgi:Tol biopolymer transport system component
LRVALEDLSEEAESGLPSSTVSPEQQQAARRRRRNNLTLAAFAALVFAVVGAAWWRNFRGSSTGPTQSTLTRVTSDSGLTSFPAISPDGSLVAYSSDRAGEGSLDIWVQQLAGGEPIRLTRGKADEYEPVFSPDGSRIAFRSEADGGGLYMVSALGGEPRRLVPSGRSARFSPDGKTLLFAIGSPGVGGAFTSGVSSIYSVGVNGGEPKRWAEDFTSATHPNWTADGRHILFIGTRNQNPIGFDVWSMPASGGEPSPAGVVKAIHELGFGGNPEPFAVHNESLIMSLRIGDTVNLWRVRFAGTPLHIAGRPEQLTFGTGLERLPSVSRDGKLVFSAGAENSDIWELPIDPNRGEAKGQPSQLTHNATEDSYPSLAADGSRLAFVSRRSGNEDVWTMDTVTGRTSLLLSTPASEFYPKLSRDGSLAAFVSVASNRTSVFTMAVSSGVANRLCDNCGMVRDLTGDGSKVVVQISDRPAHIGVLDTASRAATVLYRHPSNSIYAPKLSPDESWIAFQMVEQPMATARTIYVAPYRGVRPVPHEEWIRVTDGRFLDRNPVWSPDGRMLYFLSERDTFRCIWAQRLDASHKPGGEPFAVAHFHDAMRSLMNIDSPGEIGVTVGKNRLIYAAGELKGNIWYTRLR